MQWQAIISKILFKINKDKKSLPERSLKFMPANVLLVRIERHIANWSKGTMSYWCQMKKSNECNFHNRSQIHIAPVIQLNV